MSFNFLKKGIQQFFHISKTKTSEFSTPKIYFQIQILLSKLYPNCGRPQNLTQTPPINDMKMCKNFGKTLTIRQRRTADFEKSVNGSI